MISIVKNETKLRHRLTDGRKKKSVKSNNSSCLFWFPYNKLSVLQHLYKKNLQTIKWYSNASLKCISKDQSFLFAILKICYTEVYR